jgi:hypothetical protein
MLSLTRLFNGVICAIVLCLAAARVGAESAEIIEVFDGPMPQGWVDIPFPVPPPMQATGWQRPDFILPLYSGDYENVPAAGLENIGYLTTMIAHVAQSCDRLNPDALSFEMAPYILTNGVDTFQRMFEGELSGPETLVMLAAGMSTFTEIRQCGTTIGMSNIQRETAQTMCSDARVAMEGVGVLLNAGAAADANRFISAHACDSPQMLWMEERLAEFGRNAHRLISRPADLPELDTAEGRVYGEILGNCLRGSWGAREERYCQCYVAQLYRANPPRPLINQLALDPFVTARTYREPVFEALTDTQGMQSCFDIRGDRPREYRAPRATACLVGQDRLWEMNRCTYRSAWGVFRHMTQQACTDVITSRQWGNELGEVTCDAEAGLVLSMPVETDGPEARIWMDGNALKVDFEADVPDDYAPRLRDLVSELVVPTFVSFIRREGRGQLRLMSYQPFMLSRVPDIGFNLAMENNATDILLWRSGMVLNCAYRTEPGLIRMRSYWFETTPEIATSSEIPDALRAQIAAMSPARETCPAQMQ